MERRAINPWPWPGGAFGFVHGNELRGAERMLLVSGQTSTGADGQPVHAGDMAAQMAQAVDNLEAVLREAGLGLSDLVRLNYYTTDLEAFGAAATTGLERIAASGCEVASTLLEVQRLFHPDLLVEIEATAAA